MTTRSAVSVARLYWCVEVVALFVAPSLSKPAAAGAQAQGYCTRCEVVLTQVVRLGETGPEHTLLYDTQIVRDSRGNLYAARINSPYEVQMFDPFGRFVRQIGRRGKGPGEFQNVYLVLIGRADSLLVLDQDQRLQVFDQDGRFARALLLPLLPHALRVLGDGRLVAQGSMASRAHAGNPLFLLDVDGTVVRSFGGSGTATRLSDFTSSLRWFELSPDGTVLSVQPNRYGVERWDTTGRRLAGAGKAPDWFPEWNGAPRPVDLERPRPYQGQPMESEGVQWTSYSVADVNWKQGRTRQPTEDDRPLTMAEGARYIDILLEARDSRSGALLASRRIDHGIIAFLGGGWMYWKHEREDGLIVIDVVRATVVQP